LKVLSVTERDKHLKHLKGYNFESASAVTPFLEKPQTGPTSSFCSNLAKKLECYIVAGYPEHLEPEDIEKYSKCDQVMIDESELANEERNSPPKRKIVGANSAVLYGPKGEWIGGYRKTNLFKTDKTWAAAGVLSPETTLETPFYLKAMNRSRIFHLLPSSPITHRHFGNLHGS